MPIDREPPPREASPKVVEIFTRQPYAPQSPPPPDRIAYRSACLEVELLEQELRSLETALDVALAELTATEPAARRAAHLLQLRERIALQFEVLLRLTAAVTGSYQETAAPPAEDPDA